MLRDVSMPLPAGRLIFPRRHPSRCRTSMPLFTPVRPSPLSIRWVALVVAGAVTFGSGCAPAVGGVPEAPHAPAAVASIAPVGSDSTFDVATWNVEWFGHVERGPADEELQLRRAAHVIRGLDVDLWAVQEIVDPEHFARLIEALPGYAGFLAADPSVRLGRDFYSDFNGEEQKVGVLYRTEAVVVRSAAVILTEHDFDFAGRPPLRLEVHVRGGALGGVDGEGIDATVVVLHAKSGADPDSYARREAASAALKAHLDAEAPARPIWILGDFNDDVDVSILEERPSPYRNFVDDPLRWFIPTAALSEAGITASLGYPDLIDHHFVSTALRLLHLPGSSAVPPLLQAVPDFRETTSDHLPVVSSYRIR